MLESKKEGKTAQKFSIKTSVQHGRSADRIVEYATKEGAELIIIGNLCAGTIFSKLIKTLSSVSQIVSEKANPPVPIVH